MLPGFATDFAYAARKDSGAIEACVFNLHGQGTSSHFSYLARNIETFFYTGKAPYPGKVADVYETQKSFSFFVCFVLAAKYFKGILHT